MRRWDRGEGGETRGWREWRGSGGRRRRRKIGRGAEHGVRRRRRVGERVRWGRVAVCRGRVLLLESVLREELPRVGIQHRRPVTGPRREGRPLVPAMSADLGSFLFKRERRYDEGNTFFSS